MKYLILTKDILVWFIIVIINIITYILLTPYLMIKGAIIGIKESVTIELNYKFKRFIELAIREWKYIFKGK